MSKPKPKRYELTPEQWARIRDLLPGKPGDPGRSGADNLNFVNGVLWVLRSGAHWHDLPERYGKWKTAHKRFTRWAKAGVWERVFEHLIRDPDNDYISLDSSLVRAHQQAATGNRGDAPLAPALLEGLAPRRVLADKAYDSNALRDLITGMGAEVVIPCNPTRKRFIPYDFEAYKVRNTVERCFNKLKHFRRIATRFDCRACHFLSFLHLAAAILWMR